MQFTLSPSLRVACIVLALAATTPTLALSFLPHHPKVTHTSTREGDWRLEVTKDSFTGEVACRLRVRNHKALYRAGAVGFRFKHKWNVDDAVYRVDGGEPHALRDDLPDLVARGVPLDRGGMENASGGIVWVPYERLSGANTIAIEPRDRRAVTFHFRGLASLHDIALAQGCTPESRFVER